MMKVKKDDDIMNKDEFSMELQKIHERVLSKSLSEEEANNYTESLSLIRGV